MVEIVFTSKKTGAEFVGYLPPYATRPLAEHLLVRTAIRTGAEGDLGASIRPAFTDGCDEVVAFGLFADTDDGHVSGLIDPTCGLIAGAVNDVWAEVINHHGLEPDDTAIYELRRGADEQTPDEAGDGIRLIGDRPSPWRHHLTAPPVTDIPLEQARTTGSPSGWPCRVFQDSVLREAVAFFKSDLHNEQMGVLHGQLALARREQGLLPYVLYEAFTPLSGSGTTCSIEVGAQCQQSETALPVAALIHSHPAGKLEDEDQVEQDADGTHGLTQMSATDLYELRSGLSHVHQASFIVALPRDPEENVVLVPYGYRQVGYVSAESGFWVIDDDYSSEPLHVDDEGAEDSSYLKEQVR